MPENTPMMTSDHRQAPRVRSFLRGEILHSNGASRTECTVRDISDVGARVQISSGVTIPDLFDLSIPQRSMTMRARLVWRHGEEAGVTFANRSKPPAAASMDGSANDRLAALEAEVNRLRTQVNLLSSKLAELTGGNH